MNLRTIRDAVRPFLNLQSEYVLRRAALRLMPAHRAPTPHLIHACVWKTGSQWIRLILSDPRTYRHSGRLPFVWHKLGDSSVSSRAALLASYASPEEAYRVVPRDRARVFFVMRDPTRLFASWYVSTLVTHPLNPRITELRRLCAEKSEPERVRLLLELFEAESLGKIRAWIEEANSNPSVKLVRFEDLSGPSGSIVWSDLMAHLEIDIPENELAAVLKTYRVENLRKSSGGEDKYAKSGQTDLTTFSDDHSRQLILESTAELGQALGYPVPQSQVGR